MDVTRRLAGPWFEGENEPQKGEVLLHGIPAVRISAEERRRLFGYVEQTFHMVPGTVAAAGHSQSSSGTALTVVIG